jgi:flagellin
MAFSVNTNTSALIALQTLNQTQRSLADTQVRINSGFKVGSAKDNASTFAIAQGMRGDIAGLQSVQDTLALAQSTVAVALNAAQQISDALNTIKAKATAGQAANVDRNSIQNDINSAVNQINTVAAAAQFNGVNLLNNSSPTGLDVVSSLNRTSATSVTTASINVAAQDLRAATIGVNSINITGGTSVKFTQSAGLAFANADTVAITVTNAAGNAVNYTFEVTDASAPLTTTTTTTTDPNAAAGTVAVAVVSNPATDTPAQTLGKLFTAMRGVGLTVQNNEDGSFNVSSSGTMTAATQTIAAGGLAAGAIGSNPALALTAVESAINTVKTALGKLGTAANQLQAQGDFVKSLSNTLTTGVSTLVDADLAQESATLQALQTKQQLGIQALSIANQQSGAVLSLFR